MRSEEILLAKGIAFFSIGQASQKEQRKRRKRKKEHYTDKARGG